MPVMMGPSAVILRRAQDQGEDFWTKIESALAMADDHLAHALPGRRMENRQTGHHKHIAKGRYTGPWPGQGWTWEHPGLSETPSAWSWTASRPAMVWLSAPGVKSLPGQILPLSTIALRNRELNKILLRAGDDTTIRISPP